jgi:hypothetical protein
VTARRLPRSLEDLRGLRAARWIRESTVGQADDFGPDEQRKLQDEAISRYGLTDTGLAWSVAHSGFRQTGQEEATLGSTAQWNEMLAAAGDTYDVLVVGYVSRFARRLRTLVNAATIFTPPAPRSCSPTRTSLELRGPVGAVGPGGRRGRGLQPQARSQADPERLRREAPAARDPGRQPPAARHGARRPDDRRRRRRDRHRPPGLRPRRRRLD